ncbi:hypothetical protein B0H21DRAFT_720996 [Amylocystis lapponica]|nr:hypothetical protein B0H21DRAFT_720996 [Amylocystis lapponica]
MTSPFHLLSSTKYDDVLLDVPWNTLANGGVRSPYFMLSYHLERLRDAATTHGWVAAQSLTLADLAKACDGAVRDALAQTSSDSPLKLRILVDHAGVLTASATIAAPFPTRDPSLPTLFTADVMSSLSCLETPISNCGPVLAIYPDTEPTVSTLFTRTKTTHRPQYTAARTRLNLPPLPAPSLADVLLYTPTGELTETSIRNVAFLRGPPPAGSPPRRKGKIVEGLLMKDTIVDGEYVLTFNSVEGCRLGQIVVMK